MASKPTPGGSESNWGTELNEFLSVFLNTDGTPKFAWGYVSEAGGVHTLENSYGVDSIADISTGRVRVTFTTAERNEACVIATVLGTGNHIIQYEYYRGDDYDFYIKTVSGTLTSQPFAFFMIEETT